MGMLSKYYKYKSKYMKGGAEVGELAKPPPGGYEVKPMQEKHNSLSAAMQSNMDERQEAAEIQQQINQAGGSTDDVEPGKTPPGKIEVEGSSVLDPEQNSTLTGIRELEMQAQADTAVDGDGQKGGKRRRRRKRRKTKRKRWPPKKKSKKKRRRKGGETHISPPKATKNTKELLAQKGYKNLLHIRPSHPWNPKAFSATKAPPLWQRHHFENRYGPQYGGKKRRKTRRNKKTRNKKRKRNKKTRKKK